MNTTAINVKVRVVFVGIHDIDTLNEKFTAELYIESHWLFRYEFETEIDLNKLPENWKPKWTPQLAIENIVSETKNESWYKIGNDNGSIYIFEMRRIKGIFYEKLELEKYPFDLQHLNVSIVSNHSSKKCVLSKHSFKFSKVIKQGFRDGQEWYLYDYVGVKEDQKIQPAYSTDEEEHSKIVFFTAAARRPTYFYWNAFFMIFLITCLSFNVFSVPYTAVGQRLQPTVTLVLTSVSFKVFSFSKLNLIF